MGTADSVEVSTRVEKTAEQSTAPLTPEKKGLVGRLKEKAFAFIKSWDIRRIFQRHQERTSNPETKENAARLTLQELAESKLKSSDRNWRANRNQGPQRPQFSSFPPEKNGGSQLDATDNLLRVITESSSVTQGPEPSKPQS